MLGLLLIISVVGLSLNVTGIYRHQGGTRSFEKLLASLPLVEEVGPSAFCQQLCEQLTYRFGHGPARHDICSNYLCWAMGFVVTQLGQIYRTRDLLRYAANAICSQMSQAFVDLATCGGLQARHVGLAGHVVTEVFYDGQWHGFDADYGVSYRLDDKAFSVEDLCADPEAASEIYRHHRLNRTNDEVLEILAMAKLTHFPISADIAPRMAKLQSLLGVLKWLLPLTGLVVSIGLLGGVII